MAVKYWTCCPVCGGVLNWAVDGYDQFGAVRVLYCYSCGWQEGDDMGFKVVDLGTKKAGAIDVFLKAGAEYYGDEVKTIEPSECLGVDLKGQYRADVEAKGYAFLEADVLAEGFDLPRADYYLLFDFLEHLPSVEEAQRVLRLSLELARVGVWVRMPSFEQDAVTGEGALRKLGLRFAWSRWRGHKALFLLEHFRAVVQGHPRVREFTVRPGRKIQDSHDPCVVPDHAPIDTVRYSSGLGARPMARFDPALTGQYDAVVKLWRG